MIICKNVPVSNNGLTYFKVILQVKIILFYKNMVIKNLQNLKRVQILYIIFLYNFNYC